MFARGKARQEVFIAVYFLSDHRPVVLSCVAIGGFNALLLIVVYCEVQTGDRLAVGRAELFKFFPLLFRRRIFDHCPRADSAMGW